MTEHVKLKRIIHDIGDANDIAEAIERCNLKREYKTLLKIIYVDGGCLDDVCEAVGREYATVAKWHKPALMKLIYILQKNGKI